MLIYLQLIETEEDRSKFETIYLSYRDLMYHAAFGILRNVEDAEDAVHHAFVKIAEHMEKVGEADSPKTKGYVMTIVKNSAIDSYRRKQAYPSVEYSDATAGVEVPYDGDNALARCILRLPPRQRDLIILKYHHGYDLREIAAMLDISYRNALQIDQRAKANLRTLCQEEGIEW